MLRLNAKRLISSARYLLSHASGNELNYELRKYAREGLPAMLRYAHSNVLNNVKRHANSETFEILFDGILHSRRQLTDKQKRVQALKLLLRMDLERRKAGIKENGAILACLIRAKHALLTESGVEDDIAMLRNIKRYYAQLKTDFKRDPIDEETLICVMGALGRLKELDEAWALMTRLKDPSKYQRNIVDLMIQSVDVPAFANIIPQVMTQMKLTPSQLDEIFVACVTNDNIAVMRTILEMNVINNPKGHVPRQKLGVAMRLILRKTGDFVFGRQLIKSLSGRISNRSCLTVYATLLSALIRSRTSGIDRNDKPYFRKLLTESLLIFRDMSALMNNEIRRGEEWATFVGIMMDVFSRASMSDHVLVLWNMVVAGTEKEEWSTEKLAGYQVSGNELFEKSDNPDIQLVYRVLGAGKNDLIRSNYTKKQKLDGSMLSVLIDSLGYNGPSELLEPLYLAVLRSGRDLLEGNHFNSFIEAFCRINKFGMAVEAFKEMERLCPSEITSKTVGTLLPRLRKTNNKLFRMTSDHIARSYPHLPSI